MIKTYDSKPSMHQIAPNFEVPRRLLCFVPLCSDSPSLETLSVPQVALAPPSDMSLQVPNEGDNLGLQGWINLKKSDNLMNSRYVLIGSCMTLYIMSCFPCDSKRDNAPIAFLLGKLHANHRSTWS